MTKNWDIWDKNQKYEELFRNRTVEDSYEMESGKITSKIISKKIKENDCILDVGCGTGQYLKSLIKQINVPFKYTGVDNTSIFIESAKKLFPDNNNIIFKKANIYKLPFKKNSFDIVICCNVLSHLPELKKAIHELYRVSKRFILIRTLIGDRSFRIMHVHSKGKADNFKKNGKPKVFHYENIYSKNFIQSILTEKNIYNFKIIKDKKDINHYIILPWNFIEITK